MQENLIKLLACIAYGIPRGFQHSTQCFKSGLEKIPISQGLVTLIHICGIIGPIARNSKPNAIIAALSARFGESTHISMISNSVTNLRSYTNSPIANIAGNSARSSADIVASNEECFMLFHNVLRVFHDVLLLVHDVLRCITIFYMCFMTFYHHVLRCITIFYMCFRTFYYVL